MIIYIAYRLHGLQNITEELTRPPTYTGIPIIIAGKTTLAANAIPTGAPINVPICHKTFFFRLHGFLPQNVHPEGLEINHIDEYEKFY